LGALWDLVSSGVPAMAPSFFTISIGRDASGVSLASWVSYRFFRMPVV
jgi:hypothetical protein